MIYERIFEKIQFREGKVEALPFKMNPGRPLYDFPPRSYSNSKSITFQFSVIFLILWSSVLI